VQCYAPELNKRCRRELKPTNRSWRVDETYVRVKGKWTYLYRAVDSTGATIDFLLAARRDAAAKRFFQNALRAPGHPRPRVINVDGNPYYPKAPGAAWKLPTYWPGDVRCTGGVTLIRAFLCTEP
jgi:transposase, IS6 family